MKLSVDQLKRILCQTKPVCLHNTINIGNFLIELSGRVIGDDVIRSMLIWAKGCSGEHPGVAHADGGDIMQHPILSTGGTRRHKLLYHLFTIDQ